MDIAIIGGGAAGFFSAIAAKENYPDSSVYIFEKQNRPLQKVKISGGGRCNVTNAAHSIVDLCKGYPRGANVLKKLFYECNNHSVVEWFERRGVPLVTMPDNCIFPKSQDSQTIIDCFLDEVRRLQIAVQVSCGVSAIVCGTHALQVSFLNGDTKIFDKVIVTTGGSPTRKGLEWLENIGHVIEPPVPSLFTFTIPAKQLHELMGLVVDTVFVRILGTKLVAQGALLITHWGMSGPAILKLSAFGARVLHDKGYRFTLQVNWINESNGEHVALVLDEIVQMHGQKQLHNYRPYLLPQRLWLYLLQKAGLPAEKRWNELGKKGLNRLAAVLMCDDYAVEGKSIHKDEFVTCGGVSLTSINPKSMESRVCPNLFFAGEVLDIDGITGGFNLQAAWTTAFIAGKLGKTSQNV